MGTASSSKTLVVGSTYTQAVTCSGTTYGSNYTLTLQATLNSINTSALTANVTLSAVLKSSNYTAWSGDAIAFAVGVNGVTKNSANASSGGSSSSSTTTKTYATWTGDIAYNNDGTLIAVLTASCSDANGNYSPGDSTATINATFPAIDVGDYLGTAYVMVDGEWIQVVPYTSSGASWEKTEPYSHDGDDWVK